MKQQNKRTAFALALTLVGAALMPNIANSATPEPSFTSIVREGEFEIRDYRSQVIAEVNVAARTGSEAANRGFSPLARYIFGGNQPKAKIAMTAPVTQQSAGSDGWRIRFIMPEGSRFAAMPRPVDPNVALREEPARRYAVLRFSGLAGDRVFARKADELTNLMTTRRLDGIGAPIFAQYDPPWTVPFMRRNEVWIEIARGR